MQLVIAEKPSAASDIANVLGANSRSSDYYEGNDYVVTWCVGHVTELAPPATYNSAWKNWSLEHLPIIPDRFRLRAKTRLEDRWKVVAELLSDSRFSSVINACDAGREGELIFRNVYELAQSTLPIRRLWIRDLTPDGIRRALEDLGDGEDYELLAAAARARSRADWLVGINATRALTLSSNTQSEVLSLGRVQTPTLAMIVERDRAIERFEPDPFWRLHPTFTPADSENEATFEAVWHTDGTRRIWEKETAESLRRTVEAETGHITASETKRTRSHPPNLYDLTALQRDMNARHDLTSAQTLEAAQDLYEQGAITYPRTDSSALPSSIRSTLEERIASQQQTPWADHLADAKIENLERFVDDESVTDHHAIIPTSSMVDLDALGAHTRLVYEAVARRFLAAAHDPAQFEKMQIDVDVDGESFRAEGRRKLEEGWHAVQPPRRSSRNLPDSLPALSEGDRVRVVDIRLHDGQTRPPDRFNPNNLLERMENCGKEIADAELQAELEDSGLGTPATRAGIIQTLIDRGYVRRDGNHLLSTDLGREMIDALPETTLTSPELTARWEATLGMLEDGDVPSSAFMARVKKRTAELCEELAAETIELPSLGPEILGSCPLCETPVFAANTVYTCQSGRDCDFVVAKEIAGRKIKPPILQTLLSGKITRELDGFESKKGNTFSTRLRLSEDGSVEFVFK